MGVGRKSMTGGVTIKDRNRIQFDFKFDGVRYRPTLVKIADQNKTWSKKTHNNSISILRRAFAFGYLNHPDKLNPACGLKCVRMSRKVRPIPCSDDVAGLCRVDGRRARIGYRGNQRCNGNDSLADRPGNEYNGESQGVCQDSADCACAYRCNITPI